MSSEKSRAEKAAHLLTQYGEPEQLEDKLSKILQKYVGEKNTKDTFEKMREELNEALNHELLSMDWGYNARYDDTTVTIRTLEPGLDRLEHRHEFVIRDRNIAPTRSTVSRGRDMLWDINHGKR